jgi:hypothetical protein
MRLLRLLPRLALVLAVVFSMAACGKAASRADFVGKWKSSKLETPLHLYENGEWEIKKEDGGVLQFGVWQYTDGRIIWSVKVDGQIMHDPNKVLSVKPKEFSLAERGGTTVFKRLE